MAAQLGTITIDVRTIPSVREVLAEAWDQGRAGALEDVHDASGVDERANPYREATGLRAIEHHSYGAELTVTAVENDRFGHAGR